MSCQDLALLALGGAEFFLESSQCSLHRLGDLFRRQGAVLCLEEDVVGQ